MQRFMQRCSLLAISLFGLLAFTFAAAPVMASAQVTPFSEICKQAGANSSAVCHSSTGNNISGGNGILLKVANIFAFVTGVAAIFVIMIGGFMYITANGESGKATSGKNAVMYAIIGLLVVIVGRAIIGFVVTKIK